MCCKPLPIVFLLLCTPLAVAIGLNNENQAFDRLPACIVQNQGQMNEEVAYYIQGSDKTVYFTAEGITFALLDNKDETQKRWALKLNFQGADPSVQPEGRDQQKGVINYFRGKPENWKTSIPSYRGVLYRDLWPGIDLQYGASVDRLKYTFTVRPGTAVDKINLAYSGATGLQVTDTGTLLITTPLESLEDGKPFAFQVVEGCRKEVSVCYAKNESDGVSFPYGFEMGSYDPTLPLVIDPGMIIFCGYLGGAARDWCRGMDVDEEGNVYVTGWVESLEDSFPVKVGPDLTYNGDMYDAFVAKVNADGTALDYCGYVGGNKTDKAERIAVDSHGYAYITGNTASN